MIFELPDHSSPTDFGDNPTVVENIHITNVVFDKVYTAPIRIMVNPENLYGLIKNIRISGVTSDSGMFPMVRGERRRCA